MKLLLLLFMASVAMAQSSADVIHYAGTDLQGYSSKLKEVLTARDSKSASEWLSDLGNYKLEILRRDGDGGAELHQNWTDIFVVQAGEATIEYGGSMEDERDTGNGEIRGSRLVNAKAQKVVGGDVFVVRPGVPHQTLVATGMSFLTLIVKVERK